MALKRHLPERPERLEYYNATSSAKMVVPHPTVI
jgi:hypothetical protein